MTQRCPRCASRHHTDCDDPVGYPDVDVRYFLVAAGLAIAALAVIGYGILQILAPTIP